MKQAKQALHDIFGIDVTVDGVPYRAQASLHRTRFRLTQVRPLTITKGSILVDENGARYEVDMCMETLDGFADLLVRSEHWWGE